MKSNTKNKLDQVFDTDATQYPFNLALAVFGETEDNPDILKNIILGPLIDGVMRLNTHQKTVIYGRYIEKATRKEIAEYMRLSTSRIGQIENEAMRKLRRPDVARAMNVVSKSDYDQLSKSRNALLQENNMLRAVIQHLTDGTLSTDKVKTVGGVRLPANIKNPDVLMTPIEKLELTTRPYQILKRNRIDTVGNLASYTSTELKKMRNLGTMTLVQIIVALEKYDLKLGDIPKPHPASKYVYEHPGTTAEDIQDFVDNQTDNSLLIVNTQHDQK